MVGGPRGRRVALPAHYLASAHLHLAEEDGARQVEQVEKRAANEREVEQPLGGERGVRSGRLVVRRALGTVGGTEQFGELRAERLGKRRRRGGERGAGVRHGGGEQLAHLAQVEARR